MPRIILLDEATANQIAAGEVVERPASAVKELVENSFDAGASRVSVEIRGGGLEEIKVVDNGCGMDGTDAVNAFRRHATSKIKSIGDLEEICSLGFRGEALPSIAAVSKTVLTTRPPEADSGTRLVIQGGRILSVDPAGCPPGTVITVRDLFFNTPARLKFMKSRATESGHVADIISRLAMARPDVAVSMAVEGRFSMRTPGSGDLQSTIAAVYGSGTAEEMIALENSEEGISVRGLLAPPSVSRSSRQHVTVIINGRYVKSPAISAAVAEGYGSLLPGGRFPVAVLVVNIDPGSLDVNVHPSKMVVRVKGENLLFNLVRRSVTAALRTDRVIPSVIPAADSTYYYSPGPDTGNRVLMDPHQNKVPEYAGPLDPSLGSAGRPADPAAYTAPERSAPSAPPGRLEARPQKGLFGGGGDLLEDLYPIGFLPPTYILAGGAGGLFIIDHHAAHERILYEKILNLLSGEKIESQILLVPAVLHLPPREYQAAEENIEVLAGIGIGASCFGSGSLAVREIPAGMPEAPLEDLIRDILDYLIEAGRAAGREDLVRKTAVSAACRAAIKSGTRSTMEEAREIIRSLRETSAPYTCPHGRPTIISITDQEIRARFKRT